MYSTVGEIQCSGCKIRLVRLQHAIKQLNVFAAASYHSYSPTKGDIEKFFFVWKNACKRHICSSCLCHSFAFFSRPYTVIGFLEKDMNELINDLQHSSIIAYSVIHIHPSRYPPQQIWINKFSEIIDSSICWAITPPPLGVQHLDTKIAVEMDSYEMK